MICVAHVLLAIGKRETAVTKTQSWRNEGEGGSEGETVERGREDAMTRILEARLKLTVPSLALHRFHR